jgi:hypothetical protein
MSAASRRKGLAGEREVADRFQAAGFDVRGLESSGDHLCVHRGGLVIHSEVKRTENVRLWDLIAQMEAEAPQGTVPVGTFRRNRSRWYAVVSLDDLLRLAT